MLEKVSTAREISDFALIQRRSANSLNHNDANIFFREMVRDAAIPPLRGTMLRKTVIEDPPPPDSRIRKRDFGRLVLGCPSRLIL